MIEENLSLIAENSFALGHETHNSLSFWRPGATFIVILNNDQLPETCQRYKESWIRHISTIEKGREDVRILVTDGRIFLDQSPGAEMLILTYDLLQQTIDENSYDQFNWNILRSASFTYAMGIFSFLKWKTCLCVENVNKVRFHLLFINLFVLTGVTWSDINMVY